MFAKNELNAKRSAVMAAALEREKLGYEARLAAAKAGRPESLTEEQLEDRVEQVVAQIKRFAGKPKAEKAPRKAPRKAPEKKPEAVKS